MKLRFLPTMPLVVLESPFRAGSQAKFNAHRNYLQAIIFHSMSLGEAPFASHGFYTRFLNDDIKEERQLGMNMGKRYIELCDLVAVYHDLGVSDGMAAGIEYAQQCGKKIEWRKIHD